jgi:hypothetical protein
VFDLLLSTTNPGLRLLSWLHEGVGWERERHSFSGARHGLTIDIFTLTRPGKRGLSAMIVKAIERDWLRVRCRDWAPTAIDGNVTSAG